MLPFCGYNMGDYLAYWLKLGHEHDQTKLPKIYRVNWFRKDNKGNWLWPGYAENSRVIEWIFRRLEGTAEAQTTPIGHTPTPTALNTQGLNLTPQTIHQLLHVDPHAWLEEIPMLHDNFLNLGKHLPPQLATQLNTLTERLHQAAKSPPS
jgi:phosphoenolpyruvate carboxykinase (GTP)